MANNLSDALERVIYLSQATVNDTQAQRIIIEQLQQSVGLRESNQLEYREYYVTALQYWLKPENNLIKGEGAEFDQNTTVTKRYLALQQTIDQSLELRINPAYTCETLLNQITGDSTVVSSILSF